MTKHLVIVATHPIQYHIPLYQHLDQVSQESSKTKQPIKISVVYLFAPNKNQQGVGFNQSFQWDMNLFEGYQSHIVSHHHININHNNPWSFFGLRLKNIRQFVKSLNADAMLVTGWQSFGLIQISLVAKYLKIPLMIRGESNGLEPKPSLNRYLMSKYLTIFDYYFFIGSANKKYYVDRKINPKQLISAPYFVDNQFFSYSKYKKNISSQSDNENIFTLCFCGKLEQKKHIFHVLQALKKLNHLAIKLVVIGSGEQMESAKQYVNDHQLSVDFTGFLNQKDIRTAYKSCDCIVLPSNYKETWGLVLNEAMLHEMPAIVSNQVGSHLDLVINDKTGWVYPFANIKKLSMTIEKAAHLFLTNRVNFDKVASNAKQHVIKNFTIEKTASAIIQTTHQSMNNIPSHSVCLTKID